MPSFRYKVTLPHRPGSYDTGPRYAPLGRLLLATLVSVVIARPMKELNYTRQRHDADVRKTLVFAEDGSGLNMSALEGQLRRLMGTSMTLWRHTAAYDIWTSMYGYLPYALCFLIAAPQLFSDNKDAPRLGDLQKLVAYFDAVNTSLSFFAFNMSEVNYFRSVVQRLQEFEAATVDQHEMSSVVQDCEEGVPPAWVQRCYGGKAYSNEAALGLNGEKNSNPSPTRCPIIDLMQPIAPLRGNHPSCVRVNGWGCRMLSSQRA